ncbi:hypothetical protein RQP46_009763 [Phenoliferia psychrophenolica]
MLGHQSAHSHSHSMNYHNQKVSESFCVKCGKLEVSPQIDKARSRTEPQIPQEGLKLFAVYAKGKEEDMKSIWSDHVVLTLTMVHQLFGRIPNANLLTLGLSKTETVAYPSWIIPTVLPQCETSKLSTCALRGVARIKRTYMRRHKRNDITEIGKLKVRSRRSSSRRTASTCAKVSSASTVSMRHPPYSTPSPKGFESLGIEFARASLIRELRMVIEFDETRSAIVALSTHCDIMASRYSIMTVMRRRRGINGADTGALLSCSFEKTVGLFIQAVLTRTCTSPSLRYSTLRALLSLFLPIPSGAFRFGLLSSPEGGGGTDRHHYGIEVILEPNSSHRPAPDKEEDSSLVQSGFYVLVQPAEVPSPILKNPSKHSTPLSHHLSLTSHQMLSHQRSTDSLASSSASFSTALSTTVSEDFAAFTFTPSAARLTPFLSYAAPATPLERAQCEEYLEGLWVECVDRWVRGRGHVDELVEIGTDDEWEEA